MNGSFKKIKSKKLLWAVLKSLALGLSAGLAVSCALLLILKLCAVALNALYYVLIGAGAALIIGGIAFLIVRPTDKKVAKEVDDGYGLHESVQTALEFDGEEGAVLKLQREDAFGKLDSLPPRKPTVKKLYPIACAVALAIALTAIFVPAKVAEGDDPYNRKPTEFEILAIEELIENVQASRLETAQKEHIVDDLQLLKEELDGAETVKDVMPTITFTLGDVDVTIAALKTYDKLGTAAGANNLPDLDEGLASGDIYRQYALTSYELVVTFEESLTSLMNAGVDPVIKRMREPYNDLAVSAISPMFGELSQNLEGMLASSGVSATNELYSVLNDFKLGIDSFKASIDAGTTDEEHFQHSLDLYFSSFTDSFIDALAKQSYYMAMGRFVTNRIRIIFNMPIEKDDMPEAGSKDENTKPGEGDDKNHGGGYGGGDVEFGSDDMIYDPNTGRYVTYGELLAHYNSIVLEYLQGDSLTEEQKNMVRYYFEILFSGIKAEE